MAEEVSGPKSGSQRVVAFLTSAPQRERADAARNRERVLDAARQQITERGIDVVTMDDIAAAAGVGKGTVYRRFGDRAGLAMALLEDQEIELQEAVLSGPPPLGYGAPPVERLAAFIVAYVDYTETAADLLTAASKPAGGRYTVGSYEFWRTHVAALLRAGGVDGDTALFAEIVLAPFAIDLYLHLREDRATDEIAAAVTRAAVALLPTSKGSR